MSTPAKPPPDSPEAVLVEAQALSIEVGLALARRALLGLPSPALEDAGDRATRAMFAAADVVYDTCEAPRRKSQMEWLDADEFGRRVRLRRRMQALKKKRGGRS